MDFFDEDSFEDIVNRFFGQQPGARRQNRVIREPEEDSQFIDEKEYLYFIMELPGYEEKDIEIKVKDNIMTITAKASHYQNGNEYMIKKQKEGMTIQRTIPNKVNGKNFKKTFKNGVLEVAFSKK